MHDVSKLNQAQRDFLEALRISNAYLSHINNGGYHTMTEPTFRVSHEEFREMLFLGLLADVEDLDMPKGYTLSSRGQEWAKELKPVTTAPKEPTPVTTKGLVGNPQPKFWVLGVHRGVTLEVKDGSLTSKFFMEPEEARRVAADILKAAESFKDRP